MTRVFFTLVSLHGDPIHGIIDITWLFVGNHDRFLVVVVGS